MTKAARIYNGEKRVFLISGEGKTGQLHVKKKEIRTSLIPYTKINSNELKT